MRTKDAIPVALADPGLDSTGARLATVTSVSPEGIPYVRLDADDPPVPARLATPITRQRLESAIPTRHPVVIVFENADRTRPIIVGLIETAGEGPEPAAVVSEPGPSPAVEADIDGKRVRVTAQDEVVIQCGQASITLRRNGRVVIRGTYVETHSDGTNRIKGGQVQIN